MAEPTRTNPPAAELIGSDEAAQILGYAHRSSVTRLVDLGVLVDHRPPGSRGTTSPMLLDRAGVELVAAARLTLTGRKFTP